MREIADSSAKYLMLAVVMRRSDCVQPIALLWLLMDLRATEPPDPHSVTMLAVSVEPLAGG